MHDANGERFSFIAIQVREWPFSGQFWRDSSDDFNVAGWKACVGVIVPQGVTIAVQHNVVLLRQVVPSNFFVSTRDLSNAVIGRGVPLHLLPGAADAQILDKGQ